MDAKRSQKRIVFAVVVMGIALIGGVAVLVSDFDVEHTRITTRPPPTLAGFQPTVEARATQPAEATRVRATENVRATAQAQATAFAESPVKPIGSPLTIPVTPVALENVSFSPDGRVMAAFNAFDTDAASIWLWDAATHEVLGSLVVEQWAGQFMFPFDFSNLAFSPDGQLLAMGSCAKREDPVLGTCEQGKVAMWDVATRQAYEQPFLGHANAVVSVAFGPERMLASADCGSTILLWDITTGEVRDSLVSEGETFCAIAFSPDGKLLAAQTVGAIVLWDVATGEQAGPSLVAESVRDFGFSPDGELLISLGGGSITIWDIAAREPLGESVPGNYTRLAIHPNGRWLAAASDDGYVHLMEMATWRVVRAPLTPSPSDWYVGDLAFSPEGQVLAVSHGGLEIILLDLTHVQDAFQAASITRLPTSPSVSER
jgi:WD40 repeat protein